MNDVGVDRHSEDRLTKRSKVIGLAIAAVPLAGFSVLALGEALTLEAGWWGHLLQAGAVVLLVVLAWRHPGVGGATLIISAPGSPW